METDSSNLKEEVFQCCLNNIVDETNRKWFGDKAKSLESSSNFFIAFGLINRKLDNGPISIQSELYKKLKSINPAFSADSWTLIEFCRLAFLLQLNPIRSKEKIIKLLASADMKEQVVIYKAFQYLENAEEFLLNIIDGIRTNMIDVFDAIALENAFAFTYFREDAWNHMVLKAIFMERPIYRIYGVDERRNAKLAGILYDFVQERWAAGRTVTAELWRMMLGFVDDNVFEDLKKVIAGNSEIEKNAAIMVLQQSENKEIKDWLKKQAFQSTNMSWDDIGKEIRLLSSL